MDDMDGNPYKSPETRAESAPRWRRVWESSTFCATAILAPSIVVGGVMLFDMLQPSRQSVNVHSVGCIAMGLWSLAVLVLHGINRRKSAS
jgi:hypothetical protein